MKKLKTIFSPRKLIVWIFLLILIFTVPEVAKPAMSKTEAIVTMMSVDKIDDKIKVCTAVITPSTDKTTKYQVFSGNGSSVGEAVENISLAIGKSMGFAQCEIMAFGENLSYDGIMSSLDFMTRTRKVGRNAILINFSGELEDFQQAVVDLNMEKSIPPEDVINFDSRYIPSKDSNIHSFYKGYFSEISIGIMPKIQLLNEKKDNAIEVSMMSNNTNNSSAGVSDSKPPKKYLLNDGTISVYKNGKKHIEIEPHNMQQLNLLSNTKQEGTLKIENVTDHLYNNADVVLNIHKKNIKFKPKFKNEKPYLDINIELQVLVEEVDEENPNKNFLQRNKNFLTDTLITRTKETVVNDSKSIIEFCKSNKIDVFGVFENFYRKQYKKFKKYYEQTQEKYLDGIEYNINVKVSSSY